MLHPALSIFAIHTSTCSQKGGWVYLFKYFPNSFDTFFSKFLPGSIEPLFSPGEMPNSSQEITLRIN